MLTWILMILDLFSLTSITLIQFKMNVSLPFVIFPSLYLIGKGFVFRDFMSIIDLFFGVYLLIAFFFGISSFIYYLMLGWFVYKLFFTLIPNL